MRATTRPTGDTVDFDGLRAVVGAGEGVVARFPGIVCVARCPDPEPLRELLALCASVSGPDPGRALARRLATWMSGSTAPGPELRFGTVAAAGEQLAVFLVGAVEARVDGLGGLTLSGAHAAIGTDRLFSRPRTPVLLSLEGSQVRADPPDVYDLQAGVVPGAAVVLNPATFARDEPDTEAEAGLVGHEWFESADPLGQPPWSPGVPTQRTGEQNGAAHRPEMADDVGWGAIASGPPEPFDTEDDDLLNGSHEGRHALLSAGDPTLADSPSTSREDVPDSRTPDLRALDPRTGDPPADTVAEEESDWAPGGLGAAEAEFDEDGGADSGVDLFRTPEPAERSPTSPKTSTDALTDGAVDSLFAPAASGTARNDAPPVDDPAAHHGDVADADPSSIDWAAAEAPVPRTEEPPVDLFAAGPRDDAQPGPRARADARSGRLPAPRPTARRAQADPEPDQRGSERSGSDHPEIPGGTADVRGQSAAEATSTMPGLLFRPGADSADVGPLAGTSAPPGTSDVRQIPEGVEPARGGARIRGYRCENGHLNDPRSPTCRQCGATIDERAGGLVAGPRPPLGRLMFDDGVAHVVDGGYLVGRMPEVDDRVRTGELRPIVVEDRAGSVSRVHAEIRVSGWDVIVVDTGSRNGTYISGPEEGTWTALPPRRSRRLLPGARVRMGARMFVFESSSTVR